MQTRMLSLACSPIAVAALASVAGVPVVVHAQADGAATAPVNVEPTPKPRVEDRIEKQPGAALMNNLQARMKEIQATQDLALRQRRMDEFLKTLNRGMTDISKQPVAGARR